MELHEVTFHRLAQREYLKARRWYAAQKSEDLAQAFQDELDAVVERISRAPELGQREGTKYRWMSLKRFPYQVHYCIAAEGQVKILAVSHARRRPGYWKGRARS